MPTTRLCLATALAALASIASGADAQARRRGLAFEVAPGWQSVRGPDYRGVDAGLGIEGLVYANLGAVAVGAGFRRDKHSIDAASGGATIPRGVDAHVTISGWIAELRWTLPVDPGAPTALYLSGRGSMLTQAIGASTGSVSASIDTDGFGGGLRTGILHRLSPTVDLKGEFGWDMVQFTLDPPNGGESLDMTGFGVAFLLGVRIHLFGRSAPSP